MKKVALSSLLIGLFFALTFTQSCSKSNSSSGGSAAPMTLYDTLGGSVMVSDPANPGTMIEKGRLGLRSVVDSVIFVIAGDTAINKYFMVLLSEVGSGNLTGFNALSKNFTDFFCVATGAADFTYTGKSMVAAHDPAQNPRMNGKADSTDFNTFVGDLVIGARKNGLSTQIIGRVGTIVGTVEGQVVQR